MLKSKLMKTVMMGVVAVLMVSVVNAQPLKVSGVSVDYTSKYVWRGQNLFGSHGAMQPSVDMALFGDSGIGLNVWGSFPSGSGSEEATELDYTLSWGTSMGEGASQVDLGANIIYYDFPKANSTWDVWEVGVSADLPNLLPMGICLSYYFGYGEFVDSDVDADSMTYHSVGISKDIALGDTYSLGLSADTGYNTDMFYDGSDWTHVNFGASLGGVELAGASVSPFIGYSSSLVDDYDDYLYGGVSVGMEF